MYGAIDMKSFYASVECVERGLDPLTTNLVVADMTRTNKTICLAVSPSMKAYGVPSRPRLYEVEQIIDKLNLQRRKRCGRFVKGSVYAPEISKFINLKIDYIVAPPQMLLYEKYSARIYGVMLRYFAPEDIHVYSCDEAFIYLKPYLETYKLSAHDLVMTVIKAILAETGITATAGIGTNMYLCKVAMDIMAKKMPADKDGVRIAELDEVTYRKRLWEHTPLKDFWGYGSGIVGRLERLGVHDMGDLCLLSEKNEDKLYKEFGVNAEIIIDHAWGFENCTIKDIHDYMPKDSSISTSQVLSRAYSFSEAEIILMEMTDALVLKLVDAKCVTDQIMLSVAYDGSKVYSDYDGKWYINHYGKLTPKSLSCGKKIPPTSLTNDILREMVLLFKSRADRRLYIRRIGIAFQNLTPISKAHDEVVQYDLFTDSETIDMEQSQRKEKERKESSIQQAIIDIKKRYGKNAVLRGFSYYDCATARERNGQIGGHRA